MTAIRYIWKLFNSVKTKLFIFFLFLAGLVSCTKLDSIDTNDTPVSYPDSLHVPSSACNIESFEIQVFHMDGETITTSVTADISEYGVYSGKITLRIPGYLRWADLSILKPIIKVSEGATIFPLSETIQDFTQPLKYEVTAEDNSKKIYDVVVLN